ncbi:hypothetical protein I4F81_010168 [Pyropia yezoensis]|uniref:Uncharacterized protein n=1 Tax=Pyropia yezoensis TaxID=2788 RepID=A0ACC3CCW8_PYRYE|nr:hypothetical protein I4F81_010168 [Neopyropia yezoensis]
MGVAGVGKAGDHSPPPPPPPPPPRTRRGVVGAVVHSAGQGRQECGHLLVRAPPHVAWSERRGKDSPAATAAAAAAAASAAAAVQQPCQQGGECAGHVRGEAGLAATTTVTRHVVARSPPTPPRVWIGGGGGKGASGGLVGGGWPPATGAEPLEGGARRWHSAAEQRPPHTPAWGVREPKKIPPPPARGRCRPSTGWGTRPAAMGPPPARRLARGLGGGGGR